MQFFVPMRLPTVTSQSKITPKGTNRPIDTPALRDARDTYCAHFSQYLSELGGMGALEGPLMLEMRFIYKVRGRHKDGEPYTNKPDWDNAAKLAQDCLMRVGFFRDDTQVVEGHVYQAWGDTPGIFVRLEEI